jgi:tetratricopeptide (TPR) repeat protein
VSKAALEKKQPAPLAGGGQYALAFGVIAVMLFAVGFPVFLLFFISVLTFFIWKVFSSESRNETRSVFEFYLSANEILRDDDRRWYGFEIQEAIGRGETIVRSMSAPPPLVYFSLGALYQKLGDHSAAVKNFEQVAEQGAADESSIVFPTRDLRNYVGMLRKIERAPAEAPLTYSAIRSLERARKNRAKTLLEQSRALLPEAAAPPPPPEPQQLESVVDAAHFYDDREGMNGERPDIKNGWQEVSSGGSKPRPVHRRVKDREQRSGEAHGEHRDRKTISEVLHDIYDKNIQ